ncbi:MAG: NAD-dependent epimerase/dehydratase family protein [Gallionella sp.]
MIVAITGGTGFIGQKLVARLIEDGNVVRLLTRRSPAFAASGSLEVHECDLLAAQPDELAKILDGVEVLYHCAGQLKDANVMRALHVDATRKLAEAASGRIRHWVQLSSVGVYGSLKVGIVTEESALNPIGEYEVTKAESDGIVADAASNGGFGYSILRPSNVFGTEMANQSLFAMISMIHRDLFFFIGNPGASANYIHVDNVVDALVLCGEKTEADGQLYNLSDHRTMEQFIAVIAESLARPIPSLRVPEWSIRLPARLLGGIPGFPLTELRVDALIGRAIYSTTKIEHELGYWHIVSMEAGLKELVSSWQQRTGT